MGNAHADLFRRHPENPILTVDDWPYPANSVFNAGATLFDGQTLLLVRVEDRRGMSHLTAARSGDGVTGWRIDPAPSFLPDPARYPEEMWGVEDPRITYVKETGEYLIAYTAYSEAGPLVSLARTTDFARFERLGPILPPDDKDAAVFPVRFDDKWTLLHRPASAHAGVPAHIWLAHSPDLRHWGEFRILLRARRGGWWDANKIGLSPPPLETPEGWLVLYHGVRLTAGGCIYRLGLALLERNNPAHVLRRSDEWVFSPKEEYERAGDVDDVVFPCGWILEPDNTVKMYYGAADTCIGLAEARLGDLIHVCLH